MKLISQFICSDMQPLIDVMQLLKLDIPIVREEIKWKEKYSKLSNDKLIREAMKTPTLSTQRTRSGRRVMHKKLAEDEVSDFVEKEEANIESFDGNNPPITVQNQVEIVESVPPTPMEEQQAQHLTELLTVTNDMGKIDNFRPDPNDVSNVVIEGTDTAHLIRECVLCHKKVLGKTKQ